MVLDNGKMHNAIQSLDKTAENAALHPLIRTKLAAPLTLHVLLLCLTALNLNLLQQLQPKRANQLSQLFHNNALLRIHKPQSLCNGLTVHHPVMLLQDTLLSMSKLTLAGSMCK